MKRKHERKNKYNKVKEENLEKLKLYLKKHYEHINERKE
tara:strand:+ start:1401 stop:1517 length:117 start_codon:yes stop_codon:yes gene_type:complete